MKIIRLSSIIRFGLITTLMLISILIFFYVKFLQHRSLEHWQKMSRAYVEVKNFQLNTLFFKNEKELTNNPQINFDYLTTLLNDVIKTNDNEFVDFMIIDDQFNLVYHYLSDNSIDNDANYSTEQILYTLKSNKPSIEVRDFGLENNGGYLHIIISPYVNNQAVHKYSLVYFFDFSKQLNYVFPFYILLIIIIIIALSIYLMIQLIITHIKNYLKQISNFVSSHIFNENNKVGKLQLLPPFDDLERKISYLISQRKEIEDKYYSLTERFHLLLSQTNDGIIMEDIEGYIYFCNKKFAQIFGYKDESEVIGTKFIDLLNDPDTRRRYEIETKFRDINTRSSYRISFVNKDKEKKTCHISASNMYDTKNQIVGYYGAVTDLTDLMIMSDNELTTFESHHNQLKETNIPWILFKDDLTVYDCNKAALNLLAFHKNELRGLYVNDLFDKYDFGKILKQFDFNSNFQIDTFEPRLNKWLYIMNDVIQKKKMTYFNLIFLDITYFRKDESFHKMLFNDLNGFVFMTNHLNEVIFVSPSFFQITQYPSLWFSNYYRSLINSFSHNDNNVDEFVITCSKGKFIFKITPLSKISDSTKMYLCMLQ